MRFIFYIFFIMVFPMSARCQSNSSVASMLGKKPVQRIVKVQEAWYEKEIRLERARRERIKKMQKSQPKPVSSPATVEVVTKSEGVDVAPSNVVIFNSKVRQKNSKSGSKD